MSQDDFGQLYRRARAGDEGAFAALVAAFRERLDRFIERRMGAQVRRRCEPDDIFQNVMLTLVDRLPSYPEDLAEDELRAYAFQIAKWRIADVLKRGMREGGESVLPAEDVVAVRSGDGPVTVADERRWTREEIETLPGSYARVMRRFYVDGTPIAEIAEELGLSVDNVKQRLARGRQRLRERWSP
ncbi:MAG: sigma-70 family RNA polymerase sigma factor [Planctomycetota bacterium]